MNNHDPNLPYNDLPLLPPSVDFETVAILKQIIRSRSRLAELKGRLAQVPNPRLMIDALILQEARLSSEIENIVTTQDDLFKAASDPTIQMDPATKEVISYREAIWYGFKQLENGTPFSTRLFVEIAQEIKGPNFDIRKLPGTKIANPVTGNIIYTPPEGEAVIRDKLANLESFFNDEPHLDWDPLVKMAIGHYQFEAIHPFPDGNGRTGRILNILYLVDQNLLDWPILYLSRYIIENKTRYYQGLRSITEENAWEEWTLYILKAVEETAAETLAKVQEIVALMEQTKRLIRDQLPSIYSRELLELLFKHPYCKINFLVQDGIAKRQTASEYLQKISQIGLLEPFKIGREIYYINKGLVEVLRG